jgi:energy-coupling factor transporter ATP-binding protein EcfA2
MLKRLHLQNFTVFADADFEFSPGLNVLVGTNGTGKSHVLKVGYAVEDARARAIKQIAANDSRADWAWIGSMATSLHMVFSCPGLLPLIRWNVDEQTLVKAFFKDNEIVSFGMMPASKGPRQEGVVNTSGSQEFTSTTEAVQPVFIPAKDILTLSWILPGSEQIVIPIEKNYLDLFSQLRLLPLRKPESVEAIAILTDIVGGELRAEGDAYFLVDKTGRQVAVNMIAEGLRKFGTLQKLLANGSLTKNTTLYWDEPEANLNPALLRKLAAILAELARQGFQIILATHSTDLLKEFHILSRQKDAKLLPIKYFGLNAEPGEATRIVTTDNFEYLPDVVALSEELKQADELEEIFIREDQEYHANNRGKE